LIHFVWNNFEFISHKRFALTLIPSGFTEGNPILLGLKYYRALSDGWKDGSNCTACMEDYRRSVRGDGGCLLRNTCRCNVCLRQPPKLFDLAQYVYSKMVYNLDQFMITQDTTYGQYVYAAHSTVVRYTQLLPPTYPNINLHCRFDTLTHRLYSKCPGRGSWNGCLYRTFSCVCVTHFRHCTMMNTYTGVLIVEKASSSHSPALILITDPTNLPLCLLTHIS
jgi:hypothetical protein